MKRRILFIVLLVITWQGHAEQFLEAGLRIGLSHWISEPVYVSSQAGLHTGLQLSYTYISPRVVGVRTGLTLDRHQAGFGKHDYEDTYSTIDVDGQQMDIAYTIGNLRERQAVGSVSVPLQLVFDFKPFYWSLGPRVSFPFLARWKQTAEQASLSVYYPDYNTRVEDSYQLAASRSFKQVADGSLVLPAVHWWVGTELAYALSLGRLSPRWNAYLMVGLYFDYCFTGITPAHSTAESLMMLTDTRNGFPLQRIMTPVAEANHQGQKMVKHYSMMDVGVKLSYTLSPISRNRTCKCL